MSAPGPETQKDGAAIRDMFAGVAPRYDLLNRLLSARLDQRWRQRAARTLSRNGGGRVLDLCCGTGDLAIAVQREGFRVAAADFCLPMLALADLKYDRLPAPRPQGIAGDSLALPFADRGFAGATVAFGLRNVASLDGALAEMLRVLVPGGECAILEFAIPERPALRAAYLTYFRRVLPWIGRLVSPRGSAYTYLPSSVLDFPQRHAFTDRMTAAGFIDASWQDLTGGIVCLYTGRSPS